MASLRNQTARQNLIGRLQTLTAETPHLWGKMDAPHMICHLGDALAMALGDLPTKPSKPSKPGPFQHFPLKHLIIYVLPMPKGVPTAPELLLSAPDSFDADRQRVVQLMERMANAPRGVGPVHPFFGVLSNEEWNSLQHKHIDHHLQQFGV
jgi:hypothetical protein